MDMRINVAGLLKEQVDSTRSMDLEGEVLEIEGEAPSIVSGRLLLTRTDLGIWVSGALDISLEHVCSRCLAPFTSWVKVRMDDVFLPEVDVDTGQRVLYQDDNEADASSIDGQHVLDLADAVSQYRSGAMPLAPVCREDCAGICPECGIDRNEATCDCEPAPDPRWDKLRELLR